MSDLIMKLLGILLVTIGISFFFIGITGSLGGFDIGGGSSQMKTLVGSGYYLILALSSITAGVSIFRGYHGRWLWAMFSPFLIGLIYIFIQIILFTYVK